MKNLLKLVRIIHWCVTVSKNLIVVFEFSVGLVGVDLVFNLELLALFVH